MRQFLKRALQILNKLTRDQVRELLFSTAGELERLEAVLDSLSEGIMVLDTEHCLVLANKYARRLLPPLISDQETFWTQFGDEKAAAFLEKTLLNGDRTEGWEFDGEYNGVQRRFSLSVWPLVTDYHVTGSLIRMEDITEKKKREAQMRRMENLASLTTVAAGVAHEIKNPLGSLSIHVQLIQKTLFQEGGKRNGVLNKYLSVVNEEIGRLNQIVVDFLFAVRPMSLDVRPGNINSLITELAGFVFFELEEAGIESILCLAESLPLIEFDERYMKQALLNLIKNAIAAMSGGGKLTIGTENADGNVQITVADTGIGIPEENIAKIFEPYFTTREAGLGLGLTLVFKIVREHQGEITVKSRPGEGSVFIITLPVPQKERRLIGAPEDPGSPA